MEKFNFNIFLNKKNPFPNSNQKALKFLTVLTLRNNYENIFS